MKLLLVPIGAAVVLLLSACAPAAGSGSATPAGSGASAGPSSPPHVSSTAPINVCSKISVATVSGDTGRSVYTTAHEIDGPSAGAHLYSCQYTDTASADDALDGLNLVVYRGGNPTSILSSLAGALTAGAKPLAGIGDRAQVGDGEVDVVVGTDVVVASDALHEGQLTELSTSQLETLAHRVMALL